MLVPKIDDKKLIGLKITTVGFICVILGVMIFALIGLPIGRTIIYVGFFIGTVGMVTHFFILLKK